VKSASVTEIRLRFSDILKESESGPVVVTRDGRPVAVLVGTQDEDEIERLLMAYSPQLREILDQARKRIEEGGGIPHDEFWAQVEAENSREE
jgi:prevent-host-death family protein